MHSLSRVINKQTASCLAVTVKRADGTYKRNVLLSVSETSPELLRFLFSCDCCSRFIIGRFFAYALNDVREGMTVKKRTAHQKSTSLRVCWPCVKRCGEAISSFNHSYLAQVSRPVAAWLLGYEFMCSIRAMSSATIPFPIRLPFSFHQQEILRLRSE